MLLPRRTLLPLGLTLVYAAKIARAEAPLAVPLAVIASFSILADLVRAVGGGKIRVSALVGPDQDAHAFQLRPSDVRATAKAGLVVLNGLGFDGWAERLTQAAGYRGKLVIATRGVRQLGADPHAWQNVANVKIYVENIREGLAHADPANATGYQQAAAAYAARLDALDAEIRATLAAIPRTRRRIVTSHDAFAYYGDAYGMDFLAPQGTSTDSEPSARQLAALIAQIRAEGVRALFLENISNQQVLRQVARETGVRIGPTVYSDALSAASGPAATYLEMMRHNTSAFAATLR